MTLGEALKVAREACLCIGENHAISRNFSEFTEAAAVLARLEEELPKIVEAIDWMVTMAGDDGDRWSEEGRAECRRHTETLAVFLARLDAAPKEGS